MVEQSEVKDAGVNSGPPTVICQGCCVYMNGPTVSPFTVNESYYSHCVL